MDEAVEKGLTLWRALMVQLDERDPDGPRWGKADYHALAAEPFEIRMLCVMDSLEYNVSNGGWGQFLWNCVAHWRVMLDIAEKAYVLTGAPDHAAIIPELRRCCDHCEADAIASRARAAAERNYLVEGYPMFGEFLDRARAYDDGNWQTVFYGEQAWHARLRWLAANDGLMRRYLGQPN